MNRVWEVTAGNWARAGPANSASSRKKPLSNKWRSRRRGATAGFITNASEIQDQTPPKAGNHEQVSECINCKKSSQPASGRAALPLLPLLRAAGIPSELYPDATKLQKQFKYADAKGIPLVLVLGPEEVAAGVVKIKIMKTGEEKVLPVGEIVAALTLA